MDKSAVIANLLPNANFKETVIGGVSTIEWFDERPQPTDAEIEAHWEVMQAEYVWQSARAMAYPSIQEQLDMQYWDSVNGTTTWADAIAAVKAANPKPE